jgi:hypothetical protein
MLHPPGGNSNQNKRCCTYHTWTSTATLTLRWRLAAWLLQDTALSIAAMQRDAGLECDDEVYLDSFKPTLMDVFYDWSLGKSFAEVRARFKIQLIVQSCNFLLLLSGGVCLYQMKRSPGCCH